MRADVDLSDWSPVDIDLQPRPFAVKWVNLAGVRFADPFFFQTLRRHMKAEGAATVVRSGIDTLKEQYRTAPGLGLDGLIFHVSRCGSTLATQLLTVDPRNLVLSEAMPVNAVVAAAGAGILAPREARDILQWLIGVLGRAHLGETRYFIKFNSVSCLLLPQILELFPEVPWVLLHRDPAEIMVSALERPTSFMQMRARPELAAWLTGLSADESTRLTSEEYCAFVLARIYRSAVRALDGRALVVDYSRLPDALWDSIAPFFGYVPTSDTRVAMRERALFESKSERAADLFQDDSKSKQARITPAIEKLVERSLRELQHRVARRS